MKFGLYGINGVYNFGCEAIVRGTYRFLKDCRPDAKIIYFTYNYDYDSRILADLDIEIVAVKRQRNLVNRAINKGLSYTSFEKHILPFNWKDLINQVDVIISIGGDMYTIPEAIRNNKTYPYYNSLADFCNRAIKSKKEVVVYGASMGPWGDYQKAVHYYKENVSKYKYLICREPETIKYLNDIGIRNAFFQPDPAFLVGLKHNLKFVEKKYVGLNLSPLSLRELYGSYSVDMVGKLATVVTRIIDELDTDILLIPHVLSDVESDNDWHMLQRLKDFIPAQKKERVVFADTTRGFLGIKDQLHSCKYVVSARMHCAINAITEGVPAIFLSYSQKSQGMAQYVYGSKKWMLSIKKVESELLPLMREMNDSWEDISALLVIRMKEILHEYIELQERQQLFKIETYVESCCKQVCK